MFPDRQNSGAHGEDTCQVHVRQFRVKKSCAPDQAIGYILRRVPSRLVQKTTIFVFSTRALSLWSRTGNIQRGVVRAATDSYHEYRGLSFPSDTYYPPGPSRGPCTLTPAKHPHEKAAPPPKPIYEHPTGTNPHSTAVSPEVTGLPAQTLCRMCPR